ARLGRRGGSLGAAGSFSSCDANQVGSLDMIYLHIERVGFVFREQAVQLIHPGESGLASKMICGFPAALIFNSALSIGRLVLKSAM
ncbi:MAG: hypothetical protein ACKVU0_18680, partial [Saprospiraceae bacterium]